MSKLTKRHKIRLKKCEVEHPLIKSFYMLTVDNKGLGFPLTKQQGKFLIKWFNSIVSEYNDQTELMDNF